MNTAAVYDMIRRQFDELRVFRKRDNHLNYLKDEDLVRRNQLGRHSFETKRNVHDLALVERSSSSSCHFTQFGIADVHRISSARVSSMTTNVSRCLKNICQQHMKMSSDQVT